MELCGKSIWMSSAYSEKRGLGFWMLLNGRTQMEKNSNNWASHMLLATSDLFDIIK